MLVVKDTGLNFPSWIRSRSFTTLALVLIALAGSIQVSAVEVVLADKGQSRQPIVISKEASKPVRAAATTLADYLSRISGAKFVVQEGVGDAGIVVGLATDFPKLESDRF